jgi:KDO2-lipid IV(A) lauroyltransferase
MQRRWVNGRRFLLRRVLPILRLFPLPFASRMIAGIGKLEYRMLTELRQRFDSAVAGASEALHCSWDVPAVSEELAGNHIRWRTRDMLLDGVADRRVGRLIHVEGRESLDAARAHGRGVIILACHYGSHLMPAHWLFREQYPLRFYMERPKHVSKYMARKFQSDGPLGQDKLFISRKGDAAGSASSILRASKILKAGMLVYLAGDVRWTGPHTQPATFMSRLYNFSATWVNLATLTGAPVVPVFCQMRTDGIYQIEFREPLRIPPDTVKAGRAGLWVQDYIRMLEEQVRRYPSNSNEYFFWPTETEGIQAA